MPLSEKEEFELLSLERERAQRPARAPVTIDNASGKVTEDKSSLRDFASGNLNIGISQLAGMPVDAARNFANLGVAGYGTLKGALGGKPPDLLQPGPGSSQWFENMMRRGGMIGPSAEPESAGGRYAASALQMIPGAVAMSGASNVPMALRAAGAGVTSGLGAQAATDIGGPQYAGVGAMLPGAISASRYVGPTERAAQESKGRAFEQARSAGIPTPPRAMKVDRVGLRIQDMVTQELGLPKGAALAPETLKSYNKAQWQDYKALVDDPGLGGKIQATPAFQQRMKSISDSERALGREFPNIVKGADTMAPVPGPGGRARISPVSKPTSDFLGKTEFTTKNALGIVQRLRDMASRNLSATASDANAALGKTQRAMADAMEDLIGENLARLNKQDVMTRFQQARSRIAQSHAVMEALDPETRQVIPARLSRQLTQGVPLTGQLRTIAEMAGDLPAAMPQKDSSTNEHIFSKRMSPYGVVHPGAIAAHAGTRMLDPIQLSRPYQSLFVNPANRLTPEQMRRLRLTSGILAENRIPPPPGQ